MAQAKLEPGDKTITPAAPVPGKGKQDNARAEKDFLPELGLKRPVKPGRNKNTASPLDPDIDLKKS